MPSEFEFVPGSVRFACPHCDQSYYGTAANGHLAPRDFDCVQCGRHIGMDEMVLFPAEGLQEAQTRPAYQPWLNRSEHGRVSSWFRTIGMALVAPQRLIRLTPADYTFGSAWWFAIITQLIYAMTGLLPLLMVITFSMIGSRGGTGPMIASGLAGILCGAPLTALLGSIAVIAIWGILAHTVLVLTGHIAHGLGRTYQALCYGSGANVLMVIPCVGIYLAGSGLASVWWIVSTILMLKEGQHVHGGRATAAVLAFPVIVILGIVCIVLGSIYTKTSSQGMAVTGPISPSAVAASVGAERMHSALLAYAGQHNQCFPGHALELLHKNYLPNGDAFLVEDVENRIGQVRIGGTTLARFSNLSLEGRDRAVKAAIAGLPSKPVAHRVGDIVFTYHGIQPRSADLNLWVFVIWPDAASGGKPFGESEPVIVKTIAGSLWFPVSSASAHVGAQNYLRARYGLPPLPHPKDVTGASIGGTPSSAP